VSRSSLGSGTHAKLFRFGSFELDLEAQQLLRNGRMVRLQPQPFKLLCFLISLRGQLVTREQIRGALWSDDTFVDVEQGVNFAIKQVRDALGEDAEHPIYIQTVPKRGYRFVAPVDAIGGADDAGALPPGTDLNLQKVLWTNIADLRLAEERRVRRRRLLIRIGSAVAAVAAALLAWYLLRIFSS
jgi:DNA-binding winged helix-turn-helix (wHTH) protein